MSAIQMSIGYEYPVIELPCAFVDYYMARCKPVHALIYIHSFRQCVSGGTALSSQEISQIFDISEIGVHKALKYWENEGLVRLETHNGDISVTFLPVRIPQEERPASGGTDAPAALSKPDKPKQTGIIKSFVPSGRPQYTVEELTVYKRESKDIERLFTLAEQALGKMLTYHDMNVLFGFYDWLRLPIDVIGYLLNYCAENDKRDMRYIEKVALDWADRQIDDMEKALEYVRTFDRGYREILRSMGQNTGYPTQSQRKYMDRWLNEYQMPAALVMKACDRAAEQLGKPKFTYVDKIIEDWHKKGIKTVEAAEADTIDFRRKAEAAAKPEAKTVKNNKFVNFKQRERDYAQLEKKEREYILRQLKG